MSANVTINFAPSSTRRVTWFSVIPAALSAPTFNNVSVGCTPPPSTGSKGGCSGIFFLPHDFAQIHTPETELTVRSSVLQNRAPQQSGRLWAS